MKINAWGFLFLLFISFKIPSRFLHIPIPINRSFKILILNSWIKYTCIAL